MRRKSILDDLRQISGDPECIRCLLALEKERRGVAQDKVVFIGMGNVAKQDPGNSRRNESEFFVALLVDRITYWKIERSGSISFSETDRDRTSRPDTFSGSGIRRQP
jgi:hypothetical protein